MRFFLLILLALSSFPFASAHLAGGQDAVVGPYVIDLGHDPKILTSKELIFFSFTLVNQSAAQRTGETFVRISKGDSVAFAGFLAMTYSGSGLSFSFAEGGQYELLVRFTNEGSSVAEHTFLIDVEGEQQRTSSPFIIAGAILILAGIIASGYAIRHFSK